MELQRQRGKTVILAGDLILGDFNGGKPRAIWVRVFLGFRGLGVYKALGFKLRVLGLGL